MADKECEIFFEPAPDIYAKVNPELFTWVIENLIKNSLQACDPVTGEIRVKTSRGKDDQDVVVTVS